MRYLWAGLAWLRMIFWYAQGALSILIAAGVGYVAYQQWRTARAKVNLDLFDCRFRVFDQVRKVLGSVLLNGGASQEELTEFYRNTLETDFIFHPAIREYLKEIERRADKLWREKKLVNEANNGGPLLIARSKWAAEMPVEMKWFERQVQDVTSKFKRYMKLSNV